MKHTRSTHRSVVVGDKIVHVGGKKTSSSSNKGDKVEVWAYKGNDAFDITEYNPVLLSWSHFAETFVVGADEFNQ